jgi:hypothetical protein
MAKKTAFLHTCASWNSAPHFILPLRQPWLKALTDFQPLNSKHEIRNKENTSDIQPPIPQSKISPLPLPLLTDR